MLANLKMLEEQIGPTFWVTLALIAILLILIAVGAVWLVPTLSGDGAMLPEFVPASPAPAGPTSTGIVESRPMEVPAGVTVVGIDPAWQRLGPGETTEVAIRIENVTHLYGIETHLTFDPTHLEVQDADPDKPGIQLQTGSFPAPDFVVQNQADNGQGTIDYAISQLAPREPVDGGGTLATITIKTKGEGTSRLAFTHVKLASPDGQEIQAETLDSEITAGAGAIGVQPTATLPWLESTPAATPLPTQVPTTVPGVPTTLPSPTETSLPATAEPTVTPSPTPVQAAPTATLLPPAFTGGDCHYIVQRGDTLLSVAWRFGTTVGAIAQANGLANWNYIMAGQRLIIPGMHSNCAPPPAVPGGTVYIVRTGDTLYSIARRFGVGVNAIAQANGLTNVGYIQVGQQLSIPGGWSPGPYPPPASHPVVYIVRRGDTLHSIARRFGTTMNAIIAVNPIGNPQHIYAGQRLVIPF